MEWAAVVLGVLGIIVGLFAKWSRAPNNPRYTYGTAADGTEYVIDHRAKREEELDRMKWPDGGND